MCSNAPKRPIATFQSGFLARGHIRLRTGPPAHLADANYALTPTRDNDLMFYARLSVLSPLGHPAYELISNISNLM